MTDKLAKALAICGVYAIETARTIVEATQATQPSDGGPWVLRLANERRQDTTTYL